LGKVLTAVSWSVACHCKINGDVRPSESLNGVRHFGRDGLITDLETGHFYPTVLTVALMIQCCVRLSVAYVLWLRLSDASYRKKTVITLH